MNDHGGGPLNVIEVFELTVDTCNNANEGPLFTHTTSPAFIFVENSVPIPLIFADDEEPEIP